ncbi:MAG: acyl-CoA dehydrogenase [Planctomycetes bacterium]|nr:acyl-CoA dehydrogenase [Planctomycetota bacterium]
MKRPPRPSPYAPDTAVPLRALPGDLVRQIQWRFADRPELQRAVLAVRRAARGPVAHLVRSGARNDREWTAAKAGLLQAYDEAGVAALLLDPEHGGLFAGPKNLAAALVAFEMAWVDGGAATGCLASHLGMAPVQRRGTETQRRHYLPRLLPGPNQLRAAFALTEPLPYAGVDKGMLSGKVRIAEWRDGEEPVLHVEKRGRFITNMDFADVVTVAVESGDRRIQGSCMVVLEKGDPGTFDRGTPTKKLVHQLASTRDPVFSLRVPASRIVGGYQILNGSLVPNHPHGEILEAVFRRTRVPVGLMTAAKLLSAVEPVVRYQRYRFRGDASTPGTPRHELGLQLKQDALHRLIDVWATGEASASLGFCAARLFDAYDELEADKDRLFAARGIDGVRDQLRALQEATGPAVEYVRLLGKPAAERGPRFATLQQDALVQFAVLDAAIAVFGPATKLWNTGHGANLMREAVSLMGGSGLTEDCPGFLGQKWMDAQLEATYEGPEAVQRRQLAASMTNVVFLAQLRQWTHELKEIAGAEPQSGACTLGSAFDLWSWTLDHLLSGVDADGKPLYKEARHGVTFLMADALCWLLAARCQLLDVRELQQRGPAIAELAADLPGQLQFLHDLCRVQAARAAGEAARICTELVFGYQRHPQWRDCGACFHASHVQHLEETMPGIEGFALAMGEVVEKGGAHAPKAGPCVSFAGFEVFESKRKRLDGCLVEAHLAKDRAAAALAKVPIPPSLDY